MNLGTVKTVFWTIPDDFVFTEGFNNAHSWRGHYHEVAFVPTENVSAADVKKEIDSALYEEHEGWKGGEFSYNEGTWCHLAFVGNPDDEAGTEFEALVGRMMAEYMMRKE